jgi:hypothetical protein
MNNYVESKKQFDAIRNTAGEVGFRMAVSHLMDVGIRHLTEENVEETCNNIMKTDDSNHFMTNEFKCNLVRTAYELAQIPHTDLLVYIQREMVYDVGDSMPSYERVVHLLKGCMNWIENDGDHSETLDNFEWLGFDDDEIEALGWGYILDVKEDEDA